MITIYWYCYKTPKDKKFVEDSLNEMAEHLKKEPIKLNITIKSLRDEPELEKEAIAQLNKFNDPLYKHADYSCYISGIFLKRRLTIINTCRSSLLVYCNPESYIAKSLRKQAHSPSWGVTVNPVAFVYKRENVYNHGRWTTWHESLHLLGVDECYEENTHTRKTVCNCETCIMQYKPPENWTVEWFLCKKSIQKLQDFAESVARLRREHRKLNS
jgi:hypothetical protein